MCRWALLALAPITGASPASADSLYWDVNGTAIGEGGTATWTLTDPRWSFSTDGVSGPFRAWDNLALDDAFFRGIAGTVTLAQPVRVHNITIDTNGYVITGSSLTLDGVDPTLTVTTGTATVASTISGVGRVIKAGAGTLTLSGNNSFAGGLIVNGGSLSLTGNNSFGSAPLVTGGAALSLTGTNSFTGDISVNGALTASGAAALGSVGNNINISGGSLNIGTTGGSFAGRTVTLSGAGTVSLSGAGIGGAHFTGTGGLSVNPGVNLNDNSNDYTGRTTFYGAGATTITSIGNLGEASSVGAPTTVANGTIDIQNPSGTAGNRVVSYIGGGNVSNRNWTLYANGYRSVGLSNDGTGTLTLTGAISSNFNPYGYAPSFVAATADLELLGVVSGNGAVFSASAGRVLRLGDANTVSGISITGAGKVTAATFANAGIASSLGAGSGTSISGTLSYVGAGASTNRNWSTSGTLSNDGSGALALSGSMALSGTATLGGSYTGADNLVSGVISGTGNLRGAGSGTWLITGANSYTGQTIVDSGTLRAGSATAFAGSKTFQVNGGTLDLNGFDQSLTSLTGTGGTLALGNARLTIEAPVGTSASFGGSITGSGGLTKLGNSIQTLTGASNYTGDTMIGGGTLALDFSPAGGPASNIIGSGSNLVMSGGTLKVTGAANEANIQTFAGLTITAGNNVINAVSGTGGSMTVNLGAVTRTGGLMNFILPTNGNITTTNTALGGWATVNGTDYAKVVGGNILAFTNADYTNKDNAANWLDNEFITDVSGFFGTVAGSKQLGGLRYTRAVSTNVTVNTGETLGVDGTIIVAPTVAGGNQLITGGKLTGANGGVLGIQQNSTGNFTIASQIVDNGPGMGFTKAGSGLVTLTGTANSYTGATRVAQGVLAVASIANGGAASSIGASSAASSNLVLEGSTLRYIGNGDTSDRGLIFGKSGAILGSGIEVTNPGANLVLSGLVTSSDDAGFTKSGAGTLTLGNPANDFVGTVTVTGGLLSMSTLANGGQLSPIGRSSSASANLMLNGGGLQYTGATASTDRGFTLGVSGGNVDVTDAAATLTVSGIVASSGASLLTKNGAGTLVLSGINTYVGGNTVNYGILRAGSSQAFGAPNTSSAMTLANAAGVTLDLNGFDNTIGALNGGGANGGNVMLGSGTLRISNGGVYSGIISGTGGVSRSNAGTQVFNGCNNTYTGATTLGADISVDCLANGGAASGIGASSAASTNLVFNVGSLAYTGGSVTIDRGFQLLSTGGINVMNAGTTLEFTGAVTGAGALIKRNAGTLVLSGVNTSTGNTQIEGGVLRAGRINAFGPQGLMSLSNVAGALLDLAGYDTVVSGVNGGGALGGNISLGAATLTINSISNYTFAGTIGGTGRLVKNGAPIQTLNGCTSSFTGGVTINAGTLQVDCLVNGGLNSSIGASSADPANLVINGTLQYMGGATSTDRQFTIGASGATLDSSGTGPIQFSYAGAATVAPGAGSRTVTLTGTNTGVNILAAQLGDSATGVTALAKTGAGTWRLTNQTSNYSGATTISGGILIVDKLANGGQASTIGASSNAAGNLVIGNGSTLRYVGTGDATDRRFTLDTGVTYIESSGTGALQFTNTGTVGLTGTNATRTIALGGTNAGNNMMGGAIADNGTGRTTLAKNDSGTWVLTGNNSYTGNTVINDGNLMVGNGGTTGNAGAGNVIVNAPTSTLSLNRSDSFTFSGTLSGPGTLAQIGIGTSVLTSVSNSIGATTIAAGTLQVNGVLTTPTIAMTGTSALTVNGTVRTSAGGATALSGDGGASTITINAGGSLSANGNLGDGADTVNLAGTLATGGSTLGLGLGNDILVLRDGAAITGAGIDAGAGTDALVVDNALALALDGASITGFESLTKQNSGVLTLTGDHSYSDGTTISAGTLRVGNGGTSGTLAGDITDNATLEFNRSGTLAISGAVSGTGAVRQIGTGTTVLSGVNSYQGGTTIAAGTLQASSDANLGATSGGLSFTGGTLNTTASFTSARATNLAGTGTFSTNAGTTLTLTGVVSGTGALTKTGGGTLTLTANNSYAGLTTISGGTLQIGNGGATGSIAGNVLNNSALVFNRSGTLTMGGTIIGGGSVTQSGAGTTILTGANSYAGMTAVNAGTLLVNGNQAGATGLTSVAAGATLGGNGTIGGNVLVADGGTLAAGSNGVGALTINGNLSLGNAAQLNFEFGQPNVAGGVLNDLVNVGGDLTLGGTVNVAQTAGGSFGPGVYRMFNYAGALTNNGLSIGTMPPGSDVFVQTAIAGQVNLANTAGLTLNFWDGTGQPKNDGVIQGGNGIWRVGGGVNDWTEVNGMVNADYAQASFAIFQGSPGIVTVDDSGGNVLSAGMQFAAGGYTIAGGVLTLTGSDALIRTGDGSAGDAGIVATISADLAGTARLVKDLAGTLILSGANSYTGGTAITGGVLSVSADANLGDAVGGLSLNGGTLNTTATFGSNRAVDLAGTGTFRTDGGTALTLNGAVSGTGALTKDGTGSLVLTADNGYTGGTAIAAGTLQLGNGGTAGSILGDIVNDGALTFNRSDSLIFAGTIAGAGSVSQIGSGTTILTADSSYTGGTTISAGVLQLGSGGTTGGITGNVVNNAALTFNRSDAVTFSGAISGAGALTQVGSGTTILTGANSYTGATTVIAGTLLVNGDQTAAIGATDVASGATLGGTGIIGGNVVIANGGVLAPSGSTGPGTLAINGNLALAGGATLNYDFGQSNVVGGALNDLVNVGGNLTLAGTLNVATSSSGSFDPGIYRVINYAGSLTDNGLVIGSIPSGTDFYVQTSVAHQVNLINTDGLALRFWDGATGGRNDGVITGGDGVWQNASGNDNWTLDDASINAPFLDSAFAIFGAAPGTVTIDNSLGAVRASGMQFASDAYVIAGQDLTLIGPQSVIRVGDGSAAGAGYTATIASALVGNSQLVKSDLGTLVLSGTNSYAGGTQINAGALRVSSDANLGDAAGALTLNGGTLNTTATMSSGRAVSLLGSGTLLTDAGTTLTLDGTISGGGGFIKAGAGDLILTATNTFAGTVDVIAGNLFVSGDQLAATGAVTIASGATLGGSGIIGGDVTLADGATLAPGVRGVGTLGIGGSLSLSAGSRLSYEFGAANVAGGALNDLVNVGGNLTLAGTIDVTVPDGGSFGPGIYRVFNYAGVLTDNGLALGAIPGGSSMSVQTAIAGQINLVNTAGLTLSFWDGNTGPKNDGAIQGGDGVWRVGGGSNNWTDAGGSLNADYAQGSFAIFSSAPGTVAVDNAGGNVRASGMQFASDGYRIAGDTLTLTGPQSIIQVGDGSAASASYAATIDATLAGAAGLVKTDAGTLVLTGANSYTGGTAVNGGMLRISGDANLGDAAGGLSLDGGTLNTTATFNSNRAVTLAGAGTFRSDGSTALTLDTAITGGGALTKDGAGTLVLAGDNIYAGGTTIAAGTLQLGSGGTSGSITGDVLDNGMLAFNRADDQVFAGTITGSGSVSQTGTGTTILTADNSYTGGTVISAGALRLGNGGAAGGITGDVLDNAALVFNRADAVTFAGLVSGTGRVEQAGSGITTLTGANSYAGTTTVSGGTLLVNGDQSAATGATSVASGATLGGVGIIGGDVAIASGGALAPGMGGAGTLTVNGSLALAGGAALNYDFGQRNVVGGALNDLVDVGGNLTLRGTLNVTTTSGGAFDIGLYRVINYAGALTDNGLAIGTMPAGANVFVQTSVAHQVNLINTGSATLNFWDGAAGPKFDGAVNGGDGIWQNGTGNDNWADATGTVNAPFADDAFAIFTGAAGTVTIDNSLGAVSASGLQFAVDGYNVIGGELTLTGAQAVIRVGDGTTAEAGYTATIGGAITGNAQLVKTGTGTLVLSGANSYAGGTAINGGTIRIADDANLGAATGGLSLNGGTLNSTASFASARAIDLAGAGTFVTDAGTTLALSGAISGAGGLAKNGAGTLILSGTGSYAGPTTVGAGTLLVSGDFGAATGLTTVMAGASLGGTGTIGGSVTIANGAVLTPGAGGAETLTIGGNLSLGAGATLAYEFGSADTPGGALNDLVNVAGNLTLDGTINVSVSAGGAFDVGVYRVFNYGGALTDSGLTLGALPAGSNVSVQTSIAGQVNLVNAAGLKLNFWDGVAGPKNNHAVDGGNGVWQHSTGNDNWTDANGAVNAAYADGAFAVFGGTGGKVRVDNALGQVTATGMQFAANDYTIDGDTIALAGPQSIIRVGDGSAAGAGFTATIGAALSGDTQLVKTDGGTLLLSGTNSYTGGTAINGGTLQIARDANLGAASGNVTFDGGTLAVTTDMSSARHLVMAGAGTISTVGATTFTYGGLISGAGALAKTGSGTFLVTGDSSGYTGPTTIATGTLVVAGKLGGAVTVDGGGRLGGTGSVGDLINIGTVAPGYGGFGTLTVNGSYTGAGGQLEIKTALGGDGSQTDRLVVANGTAGTTQLVIANRGGLGAQTVEGIKVIDVTGGASNGTFTLKGDYNFDGRPAVIAGAFGYRLFQGGVSTPGDGDWYLRSALLDAPSEPPAPLYQPGVPLYENYAATLQTLNRLGTLQERVGNRQWSGFTQGGVGMWGRMEAGRYRPEAEFSTSGSTLGVDDWSVQVGLDKSLLDVAEGTLIAGVNGRYGKADASVRSRFGNGAIHIRGYGVGSTLTWYSRTGFYLDTQAQLTWYRSDLRSDVLGKLVENNHGSGLAFSVEAGKRAPLGGGLSLTPQIQMAYSGVRFDRFTDPNGAVNSSRRADSLRSRWGISLDHQKTWDGEGGTRQSHLYAIANLGYEWLDGSIVDVSGTPVARRDDRLSGELGLGGSYDWANGRFTIFSEVSASTAINNFGNSNSLRGNAGFRMRF
ncbi:autotransporter-associated beta strand repeat-containing protein [Sphingomonas sp. MMSM20]|uniref:autotransporter-associated beta strand repeat-containing protein n=1 Tax=Sphingomonas lycopersici TaxID=2951807 RepID=UPI002238AB3F|nr:autotransporter-associated beta strand repeat-containing protein [Sphingomonas lycopersici]